MMKTIETNEYSMNLKLLKEKKKRNEDQHHAGVEALPA